MKTLYLISGAALTIGSGAAVAQMAQPSGTTQNAPAATAPANDTATTAPAKDGDQATADDVNSNDKIASARAKAKKDEKKAKDAKAANQVKDQDSTSTPQ